MADPQLLAPNLKQSVEILGLQPGQRTQAHLSKVASFLRSQEGFFSALSHPDTEIICKWLGYEYIYPGQCVYNIGDSGESMYIVISGACDVVVDNDEDDGKDAPLVSGQAFGEAALVAPRRRRSCTVLASHGAGGAHLATLNRSALSNLRFYGAAQADAGRALQAVLSACCLGLLRNPPGTRSSEDVEVLAEFMMQLEAFKKLPLDMVRRLAAECSHVRLPADRVIFEEDVPGHSMYAVVSGQCQVRARPLALRQKVALAGGRALMRPWSLGIGLTMTPRKMHGAGGGGLRSLVDLTPRSMMSHGSIAGAEAEAALGSGGGRTSAAQRRQTGSSVAPVGRRGGGGGDGVEDDDDAERPQRARAGGGNGGCSSSATGTKDSPFWIARFMEDTLKRLHLSDSNAGLGLQMTPLAAVAAARWRYATSGRRGGGGNSSTTTASGYSSLAVAAGSTLPSGTGAAEGGVGGVEDVEEEGMEALLGRAAARALRLAVSEQRDRKGHNYETEVDSGAIPVVKPNRKPGGATGSDAAVVAPKPPPPLLTVQQRDADSTLTTESAGQDDSRARGCGERSRSTGSAEDPEGAEGPIRSCSGNSSSNPTTSATADATTISPVTSAAVPPPLLQTLAPPVVGPAVALEDPAKRLLSKLGNSDPANVSRALLAELVQRADVGVVLYEVAKRLVKRGGGPRRINNATSKKINRVLHHQIRAGPDQFTATVQGQVVLGRHSNVTATTRTSSLWTKGLAAAVVVPGHRPSSRHSHTHHSRSSHLSQGRERENALMVAPPPGDNSIWGEASQYPRSQHGALLTRPGSALTSAVSGFADADGDWAADDVSEVDWNGSDLYSMASFKPSTIAIGVNGRRLTPGDTLDAAMLLSTEHLTPSDMDALYGPVIRTITPGQSFGELALLHRDSRRTATVVTVSGSSGPSHELIESSTTPPGLDQVVDLMCITRQTYNYTVRAAQVTQLQGLLSFLSRLCPFRGLDDQQRASLAVFCRQREVAAGAVLAMQGEPADTLWMIMEGEVVLLEGSPPLSEPLMTRPGAARPLLLRRSSTHAVPATTTAGSGGAGSSDSRDGGFGGGARGLVRQLSAPSDSGSSTSAVRVSGSLKPSAPGFGERKDPLVQRRVMFASGSPKQGGAGIENGAGGSVASPTSSSSTGAGGTDGAQRYINTSAMPTWGRVLTCMGPGGIFGEGLLLASGPQLQPLQPPQQQQQKQQQQQPPTQQQQQQQHPPLQQQLSQTPQNTTAQVNEEDEALRLRKGRSRGPPPVVPPPYPCTAITRRATRLLTISSTDLSRFADVVATPLAALAAARGELLAARTASVSAAKEAVSERIGNARRVLRMMRLTQDAVTAGTALLYPGLAADLKLAEKERAIERGDRGGPLATTTGAGGTSLTSTPTPAPLTASASSASSLPLTLSKSSLATGSVQGAASGSGPSVAGLPPAPGRTATYDGRTLRLTGATRGLRDLAAGWVEGRGSGGRGRSRSSSSGSTAHRALGRKSVQHLLPGALMRGLQATAGAFPDAAATPAAAVQTLRAGGGGGGSMTDQVHPAGGRLAAVLCDSTPRLPASTAPPPQSPRDERRDNSTMLPAPEPPYISESSTSYNLGFSEAMNPEHHTGLDYLTTIAEESNSGFLRHIGCTLPVSSSANVISFMNDGVDVNQVDSSDDGALGSNQSSGLSFRYEPVPAESPARHLRTDPRLKPIDQRNKTDVFVTDDLRAGIDPWVMPLPPFAPELYNSTRGIISTSGTSPRYSNSSSSSSGDGGSESDDSTHDGCEDVLTADDPLCDSLGTVEEGDEDAALAEKSDAQEDGSGMEKDNVVCAIAEAEAAGTEKMGQSSEVFRTGSRPLLPPLKLPIRIPNAVDTSLSSSSINMASMPLAILQSPSTTPPSSHRLRPCSSCSLPTASELLPPRLLLNPPPSRRPPPSAPPASSARAVETLRANGSLVRDSSSILYPDISLAIIHSAAEAVAATAAAATATDESHHRPHSAGDVSDVTRTQVPDNDAAGSTTSGSLVIYTDDGSLSPDLSHVRLEAFGGGGGGGGGGGRGPPYNDIAKYHAARPLVRQVLHSPSSSSSSISEGLVPLSGFSSAATLAATSSAATVARVTVPASLGVQGVGLAPKQRPACGTLYDSSGHGLHEGVAEVLGDAEMGQLPARLPPRPLSHATATIAIASASIISPGTSDSGQSSSDGSIGISSVVRMPVHPPRLQMMSSYAEDEADLDVEVDVEAGGEETPDISRRSPSATAAAEWRINGGVAAAAVDSVWRKDAPPSPFPDAAAAAAAARRAAVQAAAAANTYPDTAQTTQTSRPILPWSHGDIHVQSSPLRQRLHSPVLALNRPLPPPSSLPPLMMAALRRQLVGDENGDALGCGPQSCSPRAALTDSPLRTRSTSTAAGGSGLVDSPVHSPRMVM